jgi:D-psicose/D-tagatose/L-ribulose 3-epimerase
VWQPEKARISDPDHSQIENGTIYKGEKMKQKYELINDVIRGKFLTLKKEKPQHFKQRLALSWSNWGFGMEKLAESAARLQRFGIDWIELHGNHYGADLGYLPQETTQVLSDYGVKVSGVCGMFSVDNDLSSNRGIHRQAALDYIKRELEFACQVGATYLLVVPGAVGRPEPYDQNEFQRSVDTLRLVAPLFQKNHILCAIEPIRSAEVSLVHTVKEAKQYIAAVAHPSVAHINGDVYHMQAEEQHIGEAILESGIALINLHMADSNRCALGEGFLDLDTIIMALYLINYNRPGCFVTPEPLGPGGNPYPAMHGKPDKAALDHLVSQTSTYFREREEAVLSLQ